MCAMRKIKWFCGSLFLLSSSVQASVVVDVVAAKNSVLELMRSEQQQLQARLKPAELHDANHLATTQPQALALNALYGVGQRLMAEVHFNGQDYMYLNGQPWPIGAHSQHQLRLITISGSCVKLAYKDQPHTLCAQALGK